MFLLILHKYPRTILSI